MTMKSCNNNVLNLGSVSEQAYRIKQLEEKISSYNNPSSGTTYSTDVLKLKQVTSVEEFFDKNNDDGSNCFLLGSELYLYVGKDKGTEGNYNQFVKISNEFKGDIINYYPGALYEGVEEPEDKDVLWLDTSDVSDLSDKKDPTLLQIQAALQVLERKLNAVSSLRRYGIISGSTEYGDVEDISTIADPLKPSILDEEDDDDDPRTSYPKYAKEAEKTVNHISILADTFEKLQAYKSKMIDHELCWATDRLTMYIKQKGNLYVVGRAGSSNDDPQNNDDVGMTLEEMKQELGQLESIQFVPIDGDSSDKKYTVNVNKYGNLQVYDSAMDELVEEPSGYQPLWTRDATFSNMPSLYINSFYLGGIDADEHSYQPCSHNFVELCNISDEDINLHGLVLMYGVNGFQEKVALWGICPAHSTYLIRGAQCSVMGVNTTRLKVNTYDIEWVAKSGNLIKFARNNQVNFYLAWANTNATGMPIKILGTDGQTTTFSEFPTSYSSIAIPDSNVCAPGYVDLIGLGGQYKEKNAPAFSSLNKNMLFTRWYSLDPVSQSNTKGNDTFSGRNNKKYWKYVDLSGNMIPYVEQFTPKATYQHKTHANDKTQLSKTSPNCCTISFGINATDNGAGATRCFNWVSVGYYDEYIRYRKAGESEWRNVESYKEDKDFKNDDNQPEIIKKGYQSYYNRIRWETYYGEALTTHKVMIAGLVPGDYEYQICRLDSAGNPTEYQSELKKFTIKSKEEVSSFKFLHITDQQGANWEEYQVWVMSAALIDREERETPGDYSTKRTVDFAINTGDIVYNGSRPCEWLDYFEGYKYLSDLAENLCLGNNDLSPETIRELGIGSETPNKANHEIFDLMYCAEMDPDNLPIFIGNAVTLDRDEKGNVVKVNVTSDTKSYKIPALYSFNYGEYHFQCLNSELRTGTSAHPNTMEGEFGVEDKYIINDGNNSVTEVYAHVEGWCVKDLMKFKGLELPNLSGNAFTEVKDTYAAQLKDCGKCIVYCHEMPLNIIATSKFQSYIVSADYNLWRETGKASLNRRNGYRFQRLWKMWGIKLILGGHKHAPSTSYPIYDAPGKYNPITSTNDELLGSMEGVDTFMPITQVAYQEIKPGQDSVDTNNMLKRIVEFLDSEDIFYYTSDGKSTGTVNTYCLFNNTNHDLNIPLKTGTITIPAKTRYLPTNKADMDDYILEHTGTPKSKPMCRMEVVEKVTAPVYFMCHATGFKNKSNSDLCTPENLFWLKDKVGEVLSNGQPNKSAGKAQQYPFYAVVECTPETVKADMYQVVGLYNPSDKAAYWNAPETFKKDSFEESKKDVLSRMSKNLWSHTEAEV